MGKNVCLNIPMEHNTGVTHSSALTPPRPTCASTGVPSPPPPANSSLPAGVEAQVRPSVRRSSGRFGPTPWQLQQQAQLSTLLLRLLLLVHLPLLRSVTHIFLLTRSLPSPLARRSLERDVTPGEASPAGNGQVGLRRVKRNPSRVNSGGI